VLGCGSTYFSESTAGSPPPPPYIVTITADGIGPSFVHVWQGRVAVFVNADNRPHSIFSDAHPTHTQCAGVVNLGSLAPGERRETPLLPSGECYFHDERDPSNTANQGVLILH
jgi:hypothetical protein